MGRKRGVNLRAVFSDAVERTTTDKSFTHAWRVSGTLAKGKSQAINGWARNEDAAKQAASIYAQRQATRWLGVNTEVVEVEFENEAAQVD